MQDIHCNFKVDYSKIKVLEGNKVADLKYPVIVSVPHAGTVFPYEFLKPFIQKLCNSAEYVRGMMQSEDLVQEIQ